MKKNYCIGWLLAGAAAMFLIAHSAASAADKVVVIPLGGDTGGVSTVTSATGRIWMDRNLGALGLATKSDDPKAYGSLYQWGRLGDGHEYRESPVTFTKSATYIPGHGNFIAVSTPPFNWTASLNDSLWQDSGINNPCPAGFRLPTHTEFGAEMASWSSNNAAGAFASLKLVMAGYRDYIDGMLSPNVGSYGVYWSSTVNGSQGARNLAISGGDAQRFAVLRPNGYSVRCIKD